MSLHWLNAALSDWEAAGLRRRLVTRQGPQADQISMAGQTLLNFGANDYLGLANDPRLIDAAMQAAAEEGWGAGASPLITGHSTAHAALEATLADWLQTEAALVFASGFAANSGTIAALVGPEDTIYSDAKNHASLIDGCRLSRARTLVYPHHDLSFLEQSLRGSLTRSVRRLIVTDSLFSMDGDLADLRGLCDLAERYDCMLLVDEAHATGILGQRGTGLVEALGLEARVPIRIGTLSKALASAGGFVAGSQTLIDWLVNRSRSYVFSTAHPPAVAAAATRAIQIVQAEPKRREQLLQRAAALSANCVAQGWLLGPDRTQIIPLRVGSPELVMQYQRVLFEQGIFVPGIRPPSVPDGESLLRVSLSWRHTAEQLQQLAAALGKLNER